MALPFSSCLQHFGSALLPPYGWTGWLVVVVNKQPLCWVAFIETGLVGWGSGQWWGQWCGLGSVSDFSPQVCADIHAFLPLYLPPALLSLSLLSLPPFFSSPYLP